MMVDDLVGGDAEQPAPECGVGPFVIERVDVRHDAGMNLLNDACYVAAAERLIPTPLGNQRRVDPIISLPVAVESSSNAIDEREGGRCWMIRQQACDPARRAIDESNHNLLVRGKKAKRSDRAGHAAKLDDHLPCSLPTRASSIMPSTNQSFDFPLQPRATQNEQECFHTDSPASRLPHALGDCRRG